MKRPILGILIAVFLCSSVAWAVKVPGLYEAEMKVPSQSEEVRSAAIKQGLLKVLTRMTGNQRVEENRRIKDGLERADYYVQEYSYSSPSVNNSNYTLYVQFNRKDLKRLLRSAGMDSWGEMRPLVLVWLVTVDEDNQVDILGNDMPGGLVTLLKQQGDKFGLPLIFPVMDVTDMNLIAPESIRTVALPQLKTASVRYSPDALLIGTVEKDKQGYQAHWNLVLGEKVWDWSMSVADEQKMVADILDDVSQVLSKRYEAAINSVPVKKVYLQVNNVMQREDLAQLIRYLKGLTPVKDVELEQVNGDSVELTVTVRGSMETLDENVSVGQTLVLISQEVDNNKMVYQWVR